MQGCRMAKSLKQEKLDRIHSGKTLCIGTPHSSGFISPQSERSEIMLQIWDLFSEEIAKKFPKMRRGINGRLELIQKFIRFGTVTRPLFYYRALGAHSKSGHLYFLFSGHNSTGSI